MTSAIAGVASFLAVMGWSTFNDQPVDVNSAFVGVGVTQGRVTEPLLLVGYERNGWQAEYSEQGNHSANNNDRGTTTQVFSVTRVFRPSVPANNWQPYTGIGVAYVRNSFFVGPSNTRLRLGLEYRGTFAIEWSHVSSAGVHRPNTGLDYVQARFNVPF
jgi:opacity protein-like surface antigen